MSHLEFIDPVLWRLFGNENDYLLENRFIPIVEIESIRRRDEFTLKRVDKVKQGIRNYNRMQDLSFSFGSLLATNIWLVGAEDNPSITQKLNEVLLENYFSWSSIAYTAYWLLIFFMLFIAVVGLDPRGDKMYAPRPPRTEG